MIGLFLIGIGIWVWVEMRERQLTWREIKGVTRFLLTSKGMEPDPVCRGCGTPLPDPLFRVELGHGAIVCEKCETEINAEVGLNYPSWFELPLPDEPKAIPPPSTYPCMVCHEEHALDHICMVELKRYVVEDKGPGSDGDWFREGQLACPNPNMNTVPTMHASKFDGYSPRNKAALVRSVVYCEHCKADHRAHEECTYKQTTCAWCPRPVPPTPASPGGGIVLCFHCIMWGRPPHPFDNMSDEDMIALFKSRIK